jgi:hypothetical protein
MVHTLDNIKVLTFAKGPFIESQKKLKKYLISIGIENIIEYSNFDLPEVFYNEFEHYFKLHRGFGYWIWKPFIILDEIVKLNKNDILIYVDSTDLPSKSFFEFLLHHFNENDALFVNRGYIHGEWTKRDCFHFMNSDNDDFYYEVQIEAGIIGMKNTKSNVELLNEWFFYMKNPNILTDTPNICGLPNLKNFKDHRHDQSILTNLIIKRGIKSINLNDLVFYNFNQPSTYL